MIGHHVRLKHSLARITILAVAWIFSVAATASAQQRLGAPAGAPNIRPSSVSSAASPPVYARPAVTPSLPSPETMLALIRTHILALDHALRTNNFYVMHALAGPYLQSRLTPDRLAQAFAPLKAAKLDLVAVAIKTPSLASAPSFTNAGMLRLRGSFPAAPKSVEFEMVFEVSGQEWRLAGIDVGVARELADAVKSHDSKKPGRVR